MSRLVEDRDKALIDREEANRRIAELRENLGRARGMLFGGLAVAILLLAAVILLVVRYLPSP
jgi:hypothetical protein